MHEIRNRKIIVRQILQVYCRCFMSQGIPLQRSQDVGYCPLIIEKAVFQILIYTYEKSAGSYKQFIVELVLKLWLDVSDKKVVTNQIFQLLGS